MAAKPLTVSPLPSSAETRLYGLVRASSSPLWHFAVKGFEALAAPSRAWFKLSEFVSTSFSSDWLV